MHSHRVDSHAHARTNAPHAHERAHRTRNIFCQHAQHKAHPPEVAAPTSLVAPTSIVVDQAPNTCFAEYCTGGAGAPRGPQPQQDDSQIWMTTFARTCVWAKRTRLRHSCSACCARHNTRACGANMYFLLLWLVLLGPLRVSWQKQIQKTNRYKIYL